LVVNYPRIVSRLVHPSCTWINPTYSTGWTRDITYLGFVGWATKLYRMVINMIIIVVHIPYDLFYILNRILMVSNDANDICC
jgi:hypothetical protein